MMREQGLYWTKKDGEWTISLYCRLGIHSGWLFFTIQTIQNDDFFEEIDENRIVREEPIKIIENFDLKEVSITPQGFAVGGSIVVPQPDYQLRP